MSNVDSDLCQILRCNEVPDVTSVGQQAQTTDATRTNKFHPVYYPTTHTEVQLSEKGVAIVLKSGKGKVLKRQKDGKKTVCLGRASKSYSEIVREGRDRCLRKKIKEN